MVYSAPVRLSRISVATSLPITVIAIWLLVVPAPFAWRLWTLQHSPGEANAASQPPDDTLYFQNGEFSFSLPRRSLPVFVFESWAAPLSKPVSAINLPGTIPEILISLPTTWPATWHPEKLTVDAWRTLAMPFYCLPFWWLLGRGCDAALGRRQLHWSALMIGTLFDALFIFTFGGTRIFMTSADAQNLGSLTLGLGLWSLAFLIFPTIWIQRGMAQRRAKRMSAQFLTDMQPPQAE